MTLRHIVRLGAIYARYLPTSTCMRSFLKPVVGSQTCARNQMQRIDSNFVHLPLACRCVYSDFGNRTTGEHHTDTA